MHASYISLIAVKLKKQMLDFGQHTVYWLTDYILGKLTDNLDLDGGFILHVLDLDRECVFS